MRAAWVTLAFVVAATPPASRGLADEIPCDAAFGPEVPRALADAVTGDAIPDSDGCALLAVSTERSVIRATWSSDGAEYVIELRPAECAEPEDTRRGDFAIRHDAVLATACPHTADALHAFLGAAQPATAVRVGAGEQRLDVTLPSPWLRAAAWACILGALAARERRRWRQA